MLLLLLIAITLSVQALDPDTQPVDFKKPIAITRVAENETITLYAYLPNRQQVVVSRHWPKCDAPYYSGAHYSLEYYDPYKSTSVYTQLPRARFSQKPVTTNDGYSFSHLVSRIGRFKAKRLFRLYHHLFRMEQ